MPQKSEAQGALNVCLFLWGMCEGVCIKSCTETETVNTSCFSKADG